MIGNIFSNRWKTAEKFFQSLENFSVPPADPIQTLLDREDWPAARRLILRDLRKTPDSHWLLDRLALTYYEQHRYTRALALSRRARELAPRCPLVLFNLAGALEMTDQPRAAIRIWRGLLRRPLRRLAWGPCGEGLLAARALRNECRYRIAKAHFHLGDLPAARLWLEAHLIHRRPGRPCTYPRRDALRLLARL